MSPPPLYVPPVCPPPADLPRHDLVPVKSDDDGDDDDDCDVIYNNNQDYDYGPDSTVRNPNASLASSESVIICRNQRMMTEDGLRPVDKVINCRRCSNRGILRQPLVAQGGESQLKMQQCGGGGGGGVGSLSPTFCVFTLNW